MTILTAVIAWALLRSGLRLTRREGAFLLGVYLVSLPVGGEEMLNGMTAAKGRLRKTEL